MKKNPSVVRLVKKIRKNVKLRAIVIKKKFGISNPFFGRRRSKKAAKSFYTKKVDTP